MKLLLALAITAAATVGLVTSQAKPECCMGRCNPYAERCLACKDCTACVACSVERNQCSVCRPK